MNRSNILFILLLLPFGVSAESFFNNATMGFSVISQSADIKYVSSDGTSTASENGVGIGVYLEKFVQKKYRYNGTFSYVSYDDFDVMNVVVSADYILPLSYNISTFAGVAGGVASQQYSSSSISDSSLAPVYGVQVGGIAYINDQLMLELGYRVRPTSLETDVENPAGTTVEVDDLSEAYLNIQLKF